METLDEIMAWAEKNENFILGGNKRTLNILTNKFLTYIDMMERKNSPTPEPESTEETEETGTADDGLRPI